MASPERHLPELPPEFPEMGSGGFLTAEDLRQRRMRRDIQVSGALLEGLKRGQEFAELWETARMDWSVSQLQRDLERVRWQGPTGIFSQLAQAPFSQDTTEMGNPFDTTAKAVPLDPEMARWASDRIGARLHDRNRAFRRRQAILRVLWPLAVFLGLLWAALSILIPILEVGG